MPDHEHSAPPPHIASFPLRGGGGEPIDLRCALLSHGVAGLPPTTIAADARSAQITLTTPAGPRTVHLCETPAHETVTTLPRTSATAAVTVTVVDGGPPPTQSTAAALRRTVRHILCLDDDLSGFYAQAANDPELAWATRGAGRIIRSATVFEDVIKTICTTNCNWSATERMMGALVGRLGEPAPDGAHAFPTATALADADEAVFADAARAGYRGRYLREIARRVCNGAFDLEALLTTPRSELPDAEVERRLLTLPGVGPYAAAHIMMLLGRHSRLVLDSWTRPNYARMQGKPPGQLLSDRTIVRRFARYRDHAGLAFWLFLTRAEIDDEVDSG